jgi:hypothetical protein
MKVILTELNIVILPISSGEVTVAFGCAAAFTLKKVPS